MCVSTMSAYGVPVNSSPFIDTTYSFTPPVNYVPNMNHYSTTFQPSSHNQAPPTNPGVYVARSTPLQIHPFFYPLHLYVFVLICQYYVVLLERTNKDIIYSNTRFTTKERKYNRQRVITMTTGGEVQHSIPTPTVCCIYCNRSHKLQNCEKLKSANYNEIRRFMREKGLCDNCLQYDHISDR